MDRRSLAALAAAQGGNPMDTFSEDFQSGMNAGASLAGLVEDSMIRDRMGKMSEAVKNGGDLTNIDESLYADSIGMRALGLFQEHYLSSREGMKKSAQRNRELAAQSAQEYYAALQGLEQNRDNPEVFAALATQLSKKLPLPYQARASDQPGKMNLYFQDVDGLKPMGRSLTHDEVLQTLKGAATSNEKLMNQIGMYLLNNIIQNMQIKQDPTRWLYAENGQQLVPQMQMHNGVFEVGYIPVGDNRFITREEAERQYGRIFDFGQYKDNRKMGQEDRQLDISQQNANTSLASVGVSRQNADTSRRRLDWEMSGGRQKELTPGQLRQVEKEYTDDLMSSEDYVRKDGSYYKKKTDEWGQTVVDYNSPAPRDTIEKARSEARELVRQNYGRDSTGTKGESTPSPRVPDDTPSRSDPVGVFGGEKRPWANLPSLWKIDLWGEPLPEPGGSRSGEGIPGVRTWR